MNKTISINIGGRIFNIEEDAYHKLEKYLKALKTSFVGRESADEIIADIEARIAELFDERIGPHKQVVTERDVEEIIAIMGRPEDYLDGEDDADESAHKGERNTGRRVYRDPDDKVILGVCSGISAYLGWDPIFLRALFVIALVFYGTGPLLYLILALIIPQAKTTAEKLRMRGEPVNVDNISKKVRESFQSVKEEVDDLGNRHEGTKEDLKKFGRRLGDLFSDLIDGLLRVLRVVGRFLAKIIGGVLLLVGMVGVAFLLALVFGVDGFFTFRHNEMGFDDQLGIWLQSLATSPGQITLLFVGSVLVILIPFVAMILAGISLLFDFRGISGLVAILMVLVFFVGVGLLAAVGINTSRDFAVETSLTERLTRPAAPSDTLVVDVYHAGDIEQSWQVKFDDMRFYYSGMVHFPGVDAEDILLFGENHLTVEDRPRGNTFQLRVERSSRGGSQKKAMDNAEKISGKYAFNEDSLRVYPYFALRTGGKLRSPKLEYILTMPLNTTVYFTPESENFIDDIPNVTNTRDRDMVGYHWRMTERGLECTDCPADHAERGRNDD